MFHRRPGSAPPDRQTMTADLSEFHQVAARLGDHPALLRRLGLVLDLEIPRGSIPDSDGTRTVEASPGDLSLVLSVARSPRTRYVLNDLQFAAHGDGWAQWGLADLPADQFHVEQMDVDGTALKLVGLAGSASRQD